MGANNSSSRLHPRSQSPCIWETSGYRRSMTRSSRRRLIGLLGLFVLSTLASAADWVSDCRNGGFDPANLACSTCALLPIDLQPECHSCCARWLDTPRTTKPYTSAVLLQRGKAGGELESFLKEDWEGVLDTVTAKRLRKLQVSGGGASFSSPYSFFARPVPSQIFFYDTPMTTANDEATLAMTAADVYDLDVLKRDDIKDMLLTLLPQAQATA
jgi:hypothetical protein